MKYQFSDDHVTDGIIDSWHEKKKNFILCGLPRDLHIDNQDKLYYLG